MLTAQKTNYSLANAVYTDMMMSAIGFENKLPGLGTESSTGFQDFSNANNTDNTSTTTTTTITTGTITNTPMRKISETIHSGQFMVSEIAESEEANNQSNNQPSHESDYEPPDTPSNKGLEYDLESACKETSRTYVYGPKSSNLVQIDSSLTKLFECMSLAYSGKITSPRWKTFKGLKLKLKDKIRLNNIIWRSWHIQYIAGRKPIVCQFSSPIDTDNHEKPQAIVLEGTYWKRRLQTVTAEYKKWRMYYSNKNGRPQTITRPTSFDWENRWPVWASTNIPSVNSDDDLMDFSDNLFSNLLPPNTFDFPNPREIARSGMGAEFIQPGLVQLQPTLDDFMDTFEPIQEFYLNTKNINPLPVLSEEGPENNSMLTEDSNQKICDSIQEQSDLLSTLLSDNSTNKMDYKPIKSTSLDNELRGHNSNQLNEEINSCITQSNVSYNVRNVNIDSPKIQSQVFSQYSPIQTIEQQNAVQVPLQQAQSIQPNESSLYSLVSSGNSFSQFGLSNVNVNANSSQDYNSKLGSLKSDYASENNLYARCDDKFAVPKYVPPKQRSRSRSISSPHVNFSIATTSTTTPGIILQPQSATSLIDINSTSSSPGIVERSISLPVYKHDNKRNTSIATKNFPILENNAQQAIYLYSPTIQVQQENTKLQTNQQINETNQSNLFQPQFLISNPNNNNNNNTNNNNNNINVNVNVNDSSNYIPQSSSSLISRLLASSPVHKRTLNTNTYQNNIRSNQNHLHTQSTSRDNVSSQSAKNSTIDASCIGIGITPTTVNDTKQTFLFSPLAFKEGTNSLQNFHQQNTNQNINQNLSINPSADIQSHPNIHSRQTTQSRQAQSRQTPVSPPTSKEILFTIPSATSPTSSNSSPKINKVKTPEDRIQYKEHRRVSHINAEQKRRCNIKNGFDTLRSLLPSINHNSTTKISKAAMLQKAAEHIRTLKSERQQQQDEYDLLKQQIENLNQTIGVFQNQLPATGVPVSYQRTNQTKELYENYVKIRTLQNWKFWIFSIIMESLLESYNSTVATTNVDEMCKTLLRWLDQNCCLVTLRRDVLNSLRYLSTSTNILTNPSTLPEEAVAAVTKKEKQKGN